LGFKILKGAKFVASNMQCNDNLLNCCNLDYKSPTCISTQNAIDTHHTYTATLP
jgi:hypothetical protein